MLVFFKKKKHSLPETNQIFQWGSKLEYETQFYKSGQSVPHRVSLKYDIHRYADDTLLHLSMKPDEWNHLQRSLLSVMRWMSCHCFRLKGWAALSLCRNFSLITSKRNKLITGITVLFNLFCRFSNFLILPWIKLETHLDTLRTVCAGVLDGSLRKQRVQPSVSRAHVEQWYCSNCWLCYRCESNSSLDEVWTHQVQLLQAMREVLRYVMQLLFRLPVPSSPISQRLFRTLRHRPAYFRRRDRR